MYYITTLGSCNIKRCQLGLFFYFIDIKIIHLPPYFTHCEIDISSLLPQVQNRSFIFPHLKLHLYSRFLSSHILVYCALINRLYPDLPSPIYRPQICHDPICRLPVYLLTLSLDLLFSSFHSLIPSTETLHVLTNGTCNQWYLG